MMSESKKISRPATATDPSTCIIGLLSFFITLILLHRIRFSLMDSTTILLLATAAPMIFFELIVFRVHSRKSTGLNFALSSRVNLSRIFTKLLGLYAIVGLIALLYWTFPEYHKDFYIPYWVFLQRLIPIFIPLSFLYFTWIDGKMVEPHDGHWQLGRLLLGKKKSVDKSVVSQLLLGWAIKMFFLPLMFVFLNNDVRAFLAFNFANITEFSFCFDFLLNLIFMIDLVFVTVGYMLSLRLIDTHLRSAERTTLGWLVALVCYLPFGNFLGQYYFFYQDGHTWKEWLVAHPNLLVFWGIIIIVLLSIYTWASVMFGLRFSNLTHRGIITSGPYALVKHPAYIAKNISWWFIAVPFVVQNGAAEGLRQSLMLFFLNVVYFLRAKTEEYHLLADKDYQLYSEWIAQNGLWSRVKYFLKS